MSMPCACARIRRSSRILTGFYDGALAESGISTMQFSLLRTLDRLGPSSIARLAEATAHERSTLSRLVKPLVAAGLLATEPGGDARERRLILTEAGRTRVAAALPRWRRAQAEVERVLGPEQDRLFSLLDRIEELR